MNSRVVTIKDEMVVRVLKCGGKMMLCAVDRQDPNKGSQPVNTATQIIINLIRHHQEDWITFTVSLLHNNTHYTLQANDSSLELAPLNQRDQVDGNFEAIWFEKVGSGNGDHYKVRVQASPEKYICIENTILILGDSDDDEREYAEFKDKAN